MTDFFQPGHLQRLANAFSNQSIPRGHDKNPIYSLMRDDFYQVRVINGDSGCLMPIAFPTGVGKTYNTLSLILEIILDEIENELRLGNEHTPRYCYYITNSVDNVFDAFNSLTKRIDESSELTQVQKDVIYERLLLAPANSKSLLDVLEKTPDALSKISSLFSIDSNASLINDLDQIRKEQSILASLNLPENDKRLFTDSLEEKASECYSKLIRHIQRVQLSDNPVPLSDKNINLLKLLIPGIALETGAARVIFMTTKKFLFGLQQSKGKFHPCRNLSGNILVIDEIDRQQHEMLTHLVSANDTDLLATIRTIHSNLKEHHLCTKPQYNGISKLFSNYLKDVQTFFEEWSLRNSFDLHWSVEPEEKQVLLFSDKLTTHTTSVNGRLKISFNNDHQQHEIALQGSFGERTEYDFPKFLGRLERLANREFHTLMRQAEELYRKNMEDILPEHEIRQLTSSQAVASILDQLNLHSLRQQISRQLNYLVGRQYSPRKSAANYHTRGIRLIEVDRLPEAKDSVMFKHHGYHVSPTGMIASWVESGCRILGISATAECESVIHNFDIHYLKEALGTQFAELTQDQREQIHAYFEKERNYAGAGVSISIIPVNGDFQKIKELMSLWQPRARNIDLLCKQMFNCEDREIEFNLTWLSKLCNAMDAFVKAKHNRYMMGMLNRGIRSSITQFLQWYSKHLSDNYTVDVKTVAGINASFLKQGLFDREVIHHLESSPGKVIALTTYQSMSSGKNPDYKFNPILENGTLKHVGHRSNERTDIDFIYLEEPTHLISVEGNPETKTSDRLLLLSYGMALQEAGVISNYQANCWTQDVVTHDSPQNVCRDIKNRYYQKGSDDCLHAVYRIVEQAVGRTARTEMKRDTIFIATDSALLQLLANDDRGNTLFSHEYKELVEYAKQEFSWANPPTDRVGRRLQNLAVLNTARSLEAIENMLRNINNNPSGDVIDSWQELRKLVLRHPATASPPTFREYYVFSKTGAEYEYSAPEDEWKVDNYRFFEFSLAPIKRVSETAARLPLIMNNSVIKSHFETNQFCTAWPKNGGYVISPPMFINIYLGALGEEAGSALLRSHEFQIESLPVEEFEQFDNIVVFQGFRALVDFKHWDLSAWRAMTVENQKEKMDKLSSKFQLLNVDKLVICNLISENLEPIAFFDEHFNCVSDEARASIMTIPSLLNPHDSSVNIEAVTKLAHWIIS